MIALPVGARRTGISNWAREALLVLLLVGQNRQSLLIFSHSKKVPLLAMGRDFQATASAALKE
jgi:hypothetical protein